MDTQKKTEQNNFEHYLQESIEEKRYVKLQYFSDIREFISLMSVTVGIEEKEGVSLLILNTGEEIPLDKIIRIDHIYSPQYAYISDFTCDC